MTSTDSGAPRPSRVAGIALLGLAAIALVIGLVTVFGGNGDGRADGNGNDQPPGSTATSGSPTSGSSEPPRSSGSSQPPSSTTRPPSSASSTPPTGTAPPGAGQTPPPGDGNGEPAKTVPVRVLNNSMIQGLAKEAAEDLKADGWNVTDVGSYSAGVIPTTTVYFRPGTDEEATARAIAEEFGMRVEPRFEGIKDASPGVIVIVTKDYSNPAGGDGDKNEG